MALDILFSDVERYKEKYIRECQKIEDEEWTPGNISAKSRAYDVISICIFSLNLFCRLEPSSEGANASKEENKEENWYFYR